MTFQRNALNLINPFDDLLNAGSVFYTSEKIDMIIQTLTTGLKVIETPHFSVLHLDVRQKRNASRLIRQYSIGLNTTFCKHVRLQTPNTAQTLKQWLAIHERRSARKMLQGERPNLGLLTTVL